METGERGQLLHDGGTQAQSQQHTYKPTTSTTPHTSAAASCIRTDKVRLSKTANALHRSELGAMNICILI
jgi:hypothetical protein